MPSVIDVRALRRRTLYPGEVQGRVGTVHYSAKAAARQGNYRAAPGAARCVRSHAAANGAGERRERPRGTGRALQKGRGTARRSDADGPGFAEGGGGAGAGQTLTGRAWRMGTGADGQTLTA